MFTYKTVGNSSVEVIINQPFTQEEVHRAFLYIDALIEDLSTKVLFSVKSELKTNLITMLNKQYLPLFSYDIKEIL